MLELDQQARHVCSPVESSTPLLQLAQPTPAPQTGFKSHQPVFPARVLLHTTRHYVAVDESIDLQMYFRHG